MRLMAPALRLERRSSDLESEVLAFERHRSIYGRGDGTRTHTAQDLNLLPLPIGLRPHIAYWGQGATPESS